MRFSASLLISLTLTVSPFLSAEAAGEKKGKKMGKKRASKNKKSSSIGIVGAGFAGLFSAVHLAELGYSDITIYEKADRVGGVASTYTLDDGRPFDLHLMWFPDSSIYGAGIPDFYERILTSYDQTLVYGDQQGTLITPDGSNPSVSLPYLNLHPGVFALLHPPFSLTRTQVIAVHVQGFHLLKNYRACTDAGLSCTECEICASPGELPFEFGARTSTTPFIVIITAIANSLGIGPMTPQLQYRTADTVLKAVSFWFPATMTQTFRYFAVTSQELETYGADPEIIEIMESNNMAGPAGYLNLKDGFQAFADAIAADFDVQLNTEVTAVNKQNKGGWTIETAAGGTFDHDILVLANPPHTEEDKVMFPDGPLQSAINLIDTTQRAMSNIFLFDVGEGNWDTNNIPAKAAPLRSFASNGPEHSFGFYLKRYANSGVVQIASTIPRGLFSGNEIEELAESQMRKLTPSGNPITKLLESRVSSAPQPLPEDEAAWEGYLDQISAMQEDGLFVNGEHVCGTGVLQLASCLEGIFATLA